MMDSDHCPTRKMNLKAMKLMTSLMRPTAIASRSRCSPTPIQSEGHPTSDRHARD